MGDVDSRPVSLPASLKDAAEAAAREGGLTLDQFVATAVAEKITASKTGNYFAARAGRADLGAFDRIMSRTGGEPPREGDEIPA